jgi:hypothetical protein
VPELPDGLFSNQKYQFGQIWEGLRRENVDILYSLSEYFMDIWDSLLPFGTFFPVLVSCTKKNLATLICAENLHSSKCSHHVLSARRISSDSKRLHEHILSLFQRMFLSTAAS